MVCRALLNPSSLYLLLPEETQVRLLNAVTNEATQLKLLAVTPLIMFPGGRVFVCRAQRPSIHLFLCLQHLTASFGLRVRWSQ